jgi:hypothetical protein
MKRTTLWVTLAATGVQLAALGLCAWAMNNARTAPVALPKPRSNGNGSPAAAVETVPLAVEITVAPVAPEPPIEPAAAAPIPEPIHVEPEPFAPAVAVATAPVFTEPAVAPTATEPEPAPMTAETELPPATTLKIEVPRFIRNFADETTEIVAAEIGVPPIVFGLFDDASIRCVDVDNGCYTGKAEGTRSRMREVAGSRAFTVQLEPVGDGSYAASFIGGLHDAQHVVLLPVSPAGIA